MEQLTDSQLSLIIGQNRSPSDFNLKLIEQICSSTCSGKDGSLTLVKPDGFDTIDIAKAPVLEVQDKLMTAYGATLFDIVKPSFLSSLQTGDGAGICKGAWSGLVKHLSVHNQVSAVEVKSDLFVDSAYMTINNSIASFTVPLRYPRIPHETQEVLKSVTPELKAEIIKDYSEHFPLLIYLIDWIIACRISPDRKQTILHLLLVSDWGKTFFLSMLQALGLAIETSEKEWQGAMQGSASGLTSKAFINHFVLAIDEATSVRSSLKMMGASAEFAPKFQMKQRVQLYAKLLLSAEPISQLSRESVEEQFINRISSISLENATTLVGRPLYQKYGHCYRDVLIEYLHGLFTERLNAYKALGQFNARAKAILVLRDHHKAYNCGIDKITDAQMIPQWIERAKEQMYYWFVSRRKGSDPDDTNRDFNQILDLHAKIVSVSARDAENPMKWTSEGRDAILIKDVNAVVSAIIRFLDGGALKGPAFFKRSAITRELGKPAQHSVKVNPDVNKPINTIQANGRIKGILLYVDELMTTTSYETPDELKARLKAEQDASEY